MIITVKDQSVFKVPFTGIVPGINSFRARQLGLHDMAGTVCSDQYLGSYRIAHTKWL